VHEKGDHVLVHQFLENSAARTPDKVALICAGQRLTYRQIEEDANRVAHALRSAGVQRGDRVAVWLPNSVEAVLAIFGILKAGGTFVVVNTTTKPDKLAYVLNNCQAKALFAPGRQADVVAALLPAVPSVTLAVLCEQQAEENAALYPHVQSFATVLAGASPERPVNRCIDVDLACLIYTSGSTGDPKGVMSTHANVAFAAASIITYVENAPDDIVINVLPLSFDYGLYQLLMTFKFGGTLVLERSFAYPAATLKRITEERVTGFPGVPTLFALLLQMDLSRFDLSSLRYLTNTAAALPVEHVERLRDAFPWARLYSMYGLTECKRTLYLPPAELARRPGSVGIAIPGTEVWIEDEAGQRLGPGEVGELVVRGAHVMQGYWQNEAATAQCYRPGRYPAERMLYTGDLFGWMTRAFSTSWRARTISSRRGARKLRLRKWKVCFTACRAWWKRRSSACRMLCWAKRSRLSWSARPKRASLNATCSAIARNTWRTSPCRNRWNSARLSPKRSRAKSKSVI
jgi:long-chain acyl-CoA synthetase